MSLGPEKVTFLLLMAYYRPRILLMIEQPTSSWLFKQTCFLEVIKRFKLHRHLTHLGLWGHDLMKATHLMGNFSALKAIETKATADKKKKHRAEVKRRQAQRRAAGEPEKVYYKRLPGGGFQGGPDLASSAVYPMAFIQAVYNCWANRHVMWV